MISKGELVALIDVGSSSGAVTLGKLPCLKYDEKMRPEDLTYRKVKQVGKRAGGGGGVAKEKEGA